MSLFDAQAMGLFQLPDACDTSAQISCVFTPNKSPNTLVLRANQLWLDVDDEPTRRYLRHYLARPQWKGRSWDEISDRALLPADAQAFAAFYAGEARIVGGIQNRLEAIAAADAAIDARVLDLYDIAAPADRQRILGSAPVTEDAEMNGDGETEEV